jgi:hypothetical protein
LNEVPKFHQAAMSDDQKIPLAIIIVYKDFLVLPQWPSTESVIRQSSAIVGSKPKRLT